MLTLRPYIYGDKFTLRTDHNALRRILNLVDASGRLARWRLRLSEFEYEVQYRSGAKHQLADGMSHLRTDGLDNSELDEEIPCFVVESSGTGLSGGELGQWTLTAWRDDQLDKEDPLPVFEVSMQDSDRKNEPITVEAFLKAQGEDAFCKSKAQTVGDPESRFDFDRYGFLVRKSPVDGALQRVVPESLRARVLYLAHYPQLAGHPGGIRMYYTLRREYYWPQMANDVHTTVRRCRSCARTQGTRYRYQKFMKLFPAAGPLEFVAMDILGPLLKTPAVSYSSSLSSIGFPS